MQRRSKDLPPSAQEQRFIQYYLDSRDLARAAVKSGFDASDGVRLYRRKHIREAIDHAVALYDRERAKLTAKANLLHVDFLDAELVKACKVAATNPAKIRALELAYERVGLRRDGDFIIPASTTDNAAPSMYQALIDRQTQTVKTEVTVERQIVAVTGSTPALPPAEESKGGRTFEVIDL